MYNIAELLHEQELLKSRISKMLYGSIEIREKNKKNIFMYTLEKMVYQHLSTLVNILMNCIF